MNDNEKQHIIIDKIKSTTITDVKVVPPNINVTGRVISDQINYNTDLTGKPLVGASLSPSEKTDSITLIKRVGDDETGWRISNWQ